jgi:putative NADPH-quinone reductase
MALTHRVVDLLKAAGHTVVLEDLCTDNFDPCLSATERASYYSPAYDAARVADQVERLLNAEALALLFPTWWFGFPAVLKGWFDRVWAPGIAYDHARDFGPIKPRLKNLQQVLAVTTLGAPWWVDRLVMRQPVKRILNVALLHTCAPGCGFDMLSLYKSEKLAPEKIARFSTRIEKRLARWPGS